MKELKNAMVELNKEHLAMGPKIEELSAQLATFRSRVLSQALMIPEGFNLLVMYLNEKLKKEKPPTSFDAVGDKRMLKDELDANVKSFVSGIVKAKADVKRTIKTLGDEQKGAAGQLMMTLTKTRTTVAKLKAITEAKKAKWYKSSKYKAKVSGYMTSLTTIDNVLKSQGESLKKLGTWKLDDAWVDKNFAFSPDMKLKDVRALSTAAMDSQLANFNARNGVIQAEAKKFRNEYKSMDGQFAMIRKWIDDAEGMEAESEEK